MDQEQQNSPQAKEGNEAEVQAKPKGKRRYIGWVVLVIILIVGGIYGYKEYNFIHTHVDTDDAQTTGNINPVLPRVSGYVAKVWVRDNEHVKKGQILVKIDTTEYALKVKQAQSGLQNARANLDVAQSSLEESKTSLQKAQLDYDRGKDLYQGGATTKQQFDNDQAALKKAKANYATAKQKVAEARTRITTQKDGLAYARLQLSYCKIKAPSDGVVSKKDVEIGQLIQPGQPLMAVTDIKDVWVVANFKETQLEYIKIGQKVDVTVDAYPDTKFKGMVQSIAGGTGAKYALLPPDNATGNFVKVVQRVPVKIVLDDSQNERDALRLGLNVTATINITQRVDSTTAAAMMPAK